MLAKKILSCLGGRGCLRIPGKHYTYWPYRDVGGVTPLRPPTSERGKVLDLQPHFRAPQWQRVVVQMIHVIISLDNNEWASDF